MKLADAEHRLQHLVFVISLLLFVLLSVTRGTRSLPASARYAVRILYDLIQVRVSFAFGKTCCSSLAKQVDPDVACMSALIKNMV